MGTEKLYEQDPYLRVFHAQVLSCEKAKQGWLVVLDRTAFYPEGGGQPGDQGVLDRVNVLDTHEKGETVVHLTDAPIPAGTRVTGGINWSLRHLHMQEHTGEHILSGLLHRFYGATNVGFHMGAACVTLDVDRPLTPEQVAVCERLANAAIWENVPVEISYPDEETLSHLAYRSKKALSGRVRIVTIPGYDVCACCGTHVARTGEIGLLKVLNVMHYKGGVRISIVCGRRALSDYTEKLGAVARLSNTLSAKPEGVCAAVDHLLAEKEQADAEKAAAQERLFQLLAASVQPLGNGWAFVFEEGLSPDALRRLSLHLCERHACAAAFSGEPGQYAYALASQKLDLRPVSKAFNAAFSGRGGGKPNLVQGRVGAASLDALRDWIAKQEQGETA